MIYTKENKYFCYYKYSENAELKDLIGKTISVLNENTRRRDNCYGNDDLIVYLKTSDGKEYGFFHEQNCCESVWLEEAVGFTFEELIGSKIIEVSEIVNPENIAPLYPNEESYTWTFYDIKTDKGFMTMRFYGCSNGYYSESVEFKEILSKSIEYF